MRRLPRGFGLLLVVLLGAAVRLLHGNDVFTPGGVVLGSDTDPYYHVLQAERILRGDADAPWFDRGLNWPLGAQVPWPPLFDGALAGAARGVHGPRATRAQVEAVAAIAPVAIGVLTLAIVAGLARVLLGPGRGTGAALVVALLGSHVAYTSVGQADQHAAEVMLHAGTLLAYVWSWTGASGGARRAAGALAGIGLALSFWNWMGSALNLVVPVAFAGIAHLAFSDRPAARRIAAGTAVALATGAALLAASIAAFGPPGALASGSLLGISGLSAVLAAAGSLFAAVLLVARRRWGVIPASLAAIALVALVPPAREGIRTGLTALGAANPWYASIFEFQHLLFSCHYPLAADAAVALMFYGLTGVPAAFAGVAILRRWRAEDDDARARLLFLACWGFFFLALALARRRFAPYFTIPLALAAWEGLHAATSGRRGWALAGALLCVAPSAYDLRLGFTSFPASSVEALRWLGEQPAPVAGREGVLSSWNLGHAVLFHAGKPVVATPFGTEGGAGAMLDTARFNFAADPERAEEILDRRRIGFVVVTNPLMDAVMDGRFAEPGNDVAIQGCSWREGLRVQYRPAYLDRVAPRLFFFDGTTRPEAPAPPLAFARLLHETSAGRREQLKVFGVVAGARVRVSGVEPGGVVRAATTVRTHGGREFEWSSAVVADASGVAVLRLPYATGANGSVEASPWRLRGAGLSATAALGESDVLRGSVVEVRGSR